MGGLKDQLLKAGLVNEKQIKKAQQEKRKENLQNQGPRKKTAEEEKLRIQQAHAEKTERDRQLNLLRKDEAEKKAQAAQIRQLIEAHRQPKGDGETPYNFVDGGIVKRLYVSDQTRARIIRGQLAIVKLDQQYELVAPDIADKISQRDAAFVMVQNNPAQATETDEVDDAYAAYRIPDDLMW